MLNSNSSEVQKTFAAYTQIQSYRHIPWEHNADAASLGFFCEFQKYVIENPSYRLELVERVKLNYSL